MKGRRVASAVGYDANEAGPRLLATGKGEAAQRIIAIAHEAGVAVIEDSTLAAILNSAVEPGEIIPDWCWEAVARILAFVRKYEV